MPTSCRRSRRARCSPTSSRSPAPTVAALAHSHRMEHGKAILAAAAAVRDGVAGKLASTPLAAARTPGTLTFHGVEWVDTAEGVATARAGAEMLWTHFDGARALELADRTFHFAPHVVDADRAALDEL